MALPKYQEIHKEFDMTSQWGNSSLLHFGRTQSLSNAASTETPDP